MWISSLKFKPTVSIQSNYTEQLGLKVLRSPGIESLTFRPQLLLTSHILNSWEDIFTVAKSCLIWVLYFILGLNWYKMILVQTPVTMSLNTTAPLAMRLLLTTLWKCSCGPNNTTLEKLHPSLKTQLKILLLTVAGCENIVCIETWTDKNIAQRLLLLCDCVCCWFMVLSLGKIKKVHFPSH